MRRSRRAFSGRRVPHRARDAVLWFGDRTHFDTYPELLHALKTGNTVVEKVYGASCFDYFEKNKEVGELFNAAMTSFSSMVMRCGL